MQCNECGWAGPSDDMFSLDPAGILASDAGGGVFLVCPECHGIGVIDNDSSDLATELAAITRAKPNAYFLADILMMFEAVARESATPVLHRDNITAVEAIGNIICEHRPARLVGLPRKHWPQADMIAELWRTLGEISINHRDTVWFNNHITMHERFIDLVTKYYPDRQVEFLAQLESGHI